jgi:hypothetical protein
LTPLATYEEIDHLGAPELRLRQACHFYASFDKHHGEGVDPLDARFIWMCYADAFLMMIVSLKDLATTDQQEALKNSDLFRMITVLRNVTVHRAVVSTASPLTMINRNIALHVDRLQPRQEDVVLNTTRIAVALDHYEQELKSGGKWKQERRNVEGARRWNDGMSAAGITTVCLSQVFLEALTTVVGICGFTMPELGT